MPYLKCDRCGLQIRIQAPFMRMDNCPRCLARHATVSPLQQSAEWVSPAAAAGWRAGAAERFSERRDRPR